MRLEDYNEVAEIGRSFGCSFPLLPTVDPSTDQLVVQLPESSGYLSFRYWSWGVWSCDFFHKGSVLCGSDEYSSPKAVFADLKKAMEEKEIYWQKLRKIVCQTNEATK